MNGFHFRVIGFHVGDWGGCSTLLFMVQAWAPSANFDMSWGPKRGRHNHWHTRLGGGRGQELKGVPKAGLAPQAGLQEVMR